MRKNISLVPLATVVGVLLGGAGWFIGYSAVYTPGIEFNGPAWAALSLAMVAGGLVGVRLIRLPGPGLCHHPVRD